MRFPRSPDRRKQEGLNGLRTRKQIELFREREAARRERAERREAEARVRHRNFDLIQRAILLVVAVAIGIAVIVGALGNADLPKLAVAGASAWAAIAAALYRFRPKSESRE
jgi:hypothetical protein